MWRREPLPGLSRFPSTEFLKGLRSLAALGDFQANIAAAEKSNAAILNIGTSAQLSFEMPPGFTPPDILDFPKTPIQYFPAFEARYIGIAASLNGGNVLHAFLHSLRAWLAQLAPEAQLPSDQVLWERMEKMMDAEGTRPQSPDHTQIHSVPLLFGERHNPAASLSLNGLTETNMGQLGGILGSLVEGLVRNLFEMITPELLKSSGGGGSGTDKGWPPRAGWRPSSLASPGLQTFRLSRAEKELDSAYGAAIIAGIYLAHLKPRHH